LCHQQIFSEIAEFFALIVKMQKLTFKNVTFTTMICFFDKFQNENEIKITILFSTFVGSKLKSSAKSFLLTYFKHAIVLDY
jgi:hypothetical protein